MRANDYKVAVFMTTFNGGSYVASQVGSILGQKNCTIKLFVSDNGSSDDTVEILKKLKLNSNNIKLFSYNKKKSFFLNFLYLISKVNISGFDFVALSDQDDIFVKNKFHKLIKFIVSNNIDGVSSAVKCFGNSSSILMQSYKLTKFDYLFEGAGQGCSFVLKADKFAKFQSFCENNYSLIKNFYYHDWLIYLFFRAKGYKWSFYNKQFLTKYRIHANNNTGNKYTFAGLKLRLNKIFDGWYNDQIKMANIIAIRINQDVANLKNISFSHLLKILIFHSRRKISDRLILMISLLFIK